MSAVYLFFFLSLSPSIYVVVAGSLGEDPLLCGPVGQSGDSLHRMILANINSFQELDIAYYCWGEGQLPVQKKKAFGFTEGLGLLLQCL